MVFKLEEYQKSSAFNRSVMYIKEYHLELLELYGKENFDWFDKRMAHCVIDAHKIKMLEAAKRITMYSLELTVNDYVDPQIVNFMFELVLDELRDDYYFVEEIRALKDKRNMFLISTKKNKSFYSDFYDAINQKKKGSW